MSESTPLSRATAKHCVAIMPCSPWKVIIYGSHKHNDGQGTLTLIEHNDRLYGITNEHVVRPDKINLMDDYLVVLQSHTFIRRKPIFTSTRDDLNLPFDIAVFDLEDMRLQFSEYGKIGVLLSEDVLDSDELFLSVGFPGMLKESKQGGVMAHPLSHVNITCRSFSENNIVAYNSAEELVEVVRMDFGGMSGGPLYKIIDEEKPEYKLVGICYEGRGTKPEDDYDSSKPHSDIWIFGFPLKKSKFTEILNSKKLNEGQSNKMSTSDISNKIWSHAKFLLNKRLKY